MDGVSMILYINQSLYTIFLKIPYKIMTHILPKIDKTIKCNPKESILKPRILLLWQNIDSKFWRKEIFIDIEFEICSIKILSSLT